MLSFSGLPQVPDTITSASGLGFGSSVPSGGSSGLLGSIGGYFGLDMGSPTTTSAASTGASQEHLGVTQPVSQGNAPQSSALGLDMGSILAGLGAVASAVSGGNPAPTQGATPASYSPVQATAASSGSTRMLVIGAAILGGVLLLRGH